jgi:twitching motility protein PilT
MKAEYIDTLLRTAVIKKASDLYLHAERSPVFRVNGELVYSDLEPLQSHDIESYVHSIMQPEQKEKFQSTHHLDLSHSVPDIARFRVNIFKQKGQTGAVLRYIPFEIPTIKDLGLPAIVEELTTRPHGLILVTGPTGSGKSTTLAAMLQHINRTRKAHIITIEDPIEYIHTDDLSVIDQREVGSDTATFAEGLRDALREDPDVILVGEMRDLDTIAMALTAAETGHLVLSTLHTIDAAQAVDRMVDVFPPHQQPQVRAQLSLSLEAILSQLLLRKKDGKGRIAAFETLVATPAIRNLIKEAKTAQIYHIIQTGREHGMQLMPDYLKELCQKDLVSFEEASKCLPNPKALEDQLKNTKK